MTTSVKSCLTTAEAMATPAPPCDRCGHPLRIRWVDVASSNAARPMWRVERQWCETAGCMPSDIWLG
ncbi:MAG TPA: hypothetical protein VGO94_04900 [Mycobacteriales bacterium]|jgi:hypothetical protein|nr:hypothetical protein [Mycobacteriales bacterium]